MCAKPAQSLLYQALAYSPTRCQQWHHQFCDVIISSVMSWGIKRCIAALWRNWQWFTRPRLILVTRYLQSVFLGINNYYVLEQSMEFSIIRYSNFTIYFRLWSIPVSTAHFKTGMSRVNQRNNCSLSFTPYRFIMWRTLFLHCFRSLCCCRVLHL